MTDAPATRIKRVTIDVLGTPAPKGSSRAMMRGGAAVNVPSGSDANRARLADWDSALRGAALASVGAVSAPPMIGVPIRMTVIWRMKRPAGHWHPKTGALKPKAPRWPATKPDTSKLLRSTEDSLTGIVWDDDSRICEHFLRKEYAAPGREGARIVVEVLE